jgi:subtilase family serine protease
MLTAATIAVVAAASAAVATGTALATPYVHAQPYAQNVTAACGPAAPGQARCFAEVRTDVHGGTGLRGPAARADGQANGTALPSGYGPADLRAAYNLPATGGTGTGGAAQTVAIVDAGDDPNAESDLAVYRATYGLPACTTANGCFQKVNESGQGSPLPNDWGWGVEISLDLDMVSAACPLCRILLVEGNSPSVADLATSENTAAALGATEISNSYGITEQNGIQPYEADYSHPGVAIVASSGDSGYGIPEFPANLTTVIAAGGTSLARSATARGWSETAWSGASSGCSAWIDKPSWQHDPDCPNRMVADVAADADPQTGPAIYYTGDYAPGWLIVGGTSAASPYIAGVIGLAGNPGDFPNASYLYGHASSLNDIVGGNNVAGENCGGDYLCTAVPGYDGPTGNGSPNGLGAF